MLRTFSAAALVTIAGVAFAQTTTQPGDTAPSVTPLQAPAIPPQGTVVVPPVTTPSPSAGAAPSIGGLSKCENLLGTEKDKCLQDERAGAGTGNTGAAPAGTIR